MDRVGMLRGRRKVDSSGRVDAASVRHRVEGVLYSARTDNDPY